MYNNVGGAWRERKTDRQGAHESRNLIDPTTVQVISANSKMLTKGEGN